MPISAGLIEKSLRPQFVWDNKSTGKWLLCNIDRSEFFQKDLGILVFINLAIIYECLAPDIQFLIGVDNADFSFYVAQLEFIQTYEGESQFNTWLQQQVRIKTQLTINLIYFRHGIKI